MSLSFQGFYLGEIAMGSLLTDVLLYGLLLGLDCWCWPSHRGLASGSKSWILFFQARLHLVEWIGLCRMFRFRLMQLLQNYWCITHPRTSFLHCWLDDGLLRKKHVFIVRNLFRMVVREWFSNFYLRGCLWSYFVNVQSITNLSNSATATLNAGKVVRLKFFLWGFRCIRH